MILFFISHFLIPHNYETATALFAEVEKLPKTAAIYIDFNLKQKGDGLSVAEKLFRLGYRELFITTGAKREKIQSGFVRGVLGKEPPFGRNQTNQTDGNRKDRPIFGHAPHCFETLIQTKSSDIKLLGRTQLLAQSLRLARKLEVRSKL